MKTATLEGLPPEQVVSFAAAIMGKKGGLVKNAKRAAASRRNGKLSNGRPRKK